MIIFLFDGRLQANYVLWISVCFIVLGARGVLVLGPIRPPSTNGSGKSIDLRRALEVNLHAFLGDGVADFTLLSPDIWNRSSARDHRDAKILDRIAQDVRTVNGYFYDITDEERRVEIEQIRALTDPYPGQEKAIAASYQDDQEHAAVVAIWKIRRTLDA
jgi:hypothetical protein